MNIKLYLKKLIFPFVLTIAYFSCLQVLWIEDVSVFIHSTYYIILMIYLFYLGELTVLWQQIKERLHYFSFLKSVMITILLSMLLGYIYNQFLISQLGNVTIGRGYIIPTGNIKYMIVWFLVMAIMKPIVDSIIYHRLIICLDTRQASYITFIFSVIAQAIMEMGSMSGGITILLMSIPPTLTYLYTKEISASFMAQFLVNLANAIAIFYFFI